MIITNINTNKISNTFCEKNIGLPKHTEGIIYWFALRDKLINRYKNITHNAYIFYDIIYNNDGGWDIESII